MQGPGRADIVNAGSGESGYSECRDELNIFFCLKMFFFFFLFKRFKMS
ncbi:unnamed protein product [Staurois parvus]|uniref:Uncharacterized protein n=1 Tax=Staurois parvus TaxID=386267 RepID=A0ABN9F5M0_9NEOB|nr:unnamed protein product [Staurois parvus]